MRRDICLVYQRHIHDVYNAYISSIKQCFDSECNATPYYVIGYGIGFSFRYNMNGGGCTIRLMPYNGGTAVNVRYTLAQWAGARYEAHNKELTKYVARELGCEPYEADIDAEEFLKPENQMSQPLPQAQPTYQPQYDPQPQYQAHMMPLPQPQPRPEPQYQAQPQPQVQPQIQPTVKVCDGCGAELKENAKFCSSCGKAVTPLAQNCPNCNATVDSNDRFCSECGAKLK